MPVKPPALPSSNRAAPVPPPLPPRPLSGLSFGFLGLKVAALLGLAVVSVLFGAFAPALLRRPAACPVVQGGSLEEPLTSSHPPEIVARPTLPETDPPASTQNATDAAKPAPKPLTPSPFVTLAIQPQLPTSGSVATIARLIDREIDKALTQAKIPASPLASDAEFIRRVSLDLVGKIPSSDRVRAFLAESDPLKRSKYIDELLASQDYGRHFARLWTEILIKRDFDSNKGLSTGPFTNWLAERFNENAKWDGVVREMITAEGEEAKTPQSLFIMANQDNKQPSPPKLVGAVGNLFMGVQIQCAECHKHPYINKWDKNDFWGVAAFFGHTKITRPNGKANKMTGPATITEIQASPAPKDKKDKKAKLAGPAIKAGLVIGIPDPNDPRKTIGTAKGKFFESNQLPQVNTAPYRPTLAKWLTAGENPYFAPSAVNRLWAHFFAKGIVHPIEEMSELNQGSHPELLAELARAFVASKFDLKEMIRGICNSNAYQRTSRPLPENQENETLFARMPVRVMDAKQLVDSLKLATTQSVTLRAEAQNKRNRDAGDPLLRALDTKEYDDESTEFTYGIPQLLKMMNTQLTNAGTERVKQILAKHGSDRQKILEEIWLTALSRRPSEAEIARIEAYLSKQSDALQGYSGVFWALLNSAEFLSNH
jgi:hypothetical protein